VSQAGFRGRLLSGERLVGTLVTLPGSAFAELVASWFDYVCVDLEHAALGAGELQDAVVGAQASGAAALARVPLERGLLTPALDCGVDGVVAPMVEDDATAAEYAARMRYPSEGTRGFGPRRGARRPAATPTLIAQIETAAGVEAAPAIARVDGVDALLVGTSDLSFDLGVPFALDDERLRACVAEVRDSARAAGCAFGIAGALEPGRLGSELERDASLLAIATDMALCSAAFEDAAGVWRG
jgi:2-keto-3-deoxy-L-rhamnonate aldolase RhmA